MGFLEVNVWSITPLNFMVEHQNSLTKESRQGTPILGQTRPLIFPAHALHTPPTSIPFINLNSLVINRSGKFRTKPQIKR